MPEYTDISGAILFMEVNLQEAKSFLSFQDGFIIYELSNEVPNPDDYMIKYSVTSNELKKEY